MCLCGMHRLQSVLHKFADSEIANFNRSTAVVKKYISWLKYNLLLKTTKNTYSQIAMNNMTVMAISESPTYLYEQVQNLIYLHIVLFMLLNQISQVSIFTILH